MVAQALKLRGREYVILERREYDLLIAGRGGNPRRGTRKAAASKTTMPELPAPDRRGFRPARKTLQAILARDIIKDRVALGWSQRELARRAKIRPETLSRIESGVHTPTVATIERIDRALSSLSPT